MGEVKTLQIVHTYLGTILFFMGGLYLGCDQHKEVLSGQSGSLIRIAVYGVATIPFTLSLFITYKKLLNCSYIKRGLSQLSFGLIIFFSIPYLKSLVEVVYSFYIFFIPGFMVTFLYYLYHPAITVYIILSYFVFTFRENKT